MVRRWQLDPSKSSTLILAADSRLSQTDYVDDQSWRLQVGQGDEPAAVLQSAYGGRITSASLVPVWTHENRSIYEARAYHRPPLITAFTAGYARIEAELIPDIMVIAEYWVAESHAITGCFTVQNKSQDAIALRFDLHGHIIQRTQELQISILTLHDDSNALYFGRIGNIDPVVVVDQGTFGVGQDGHVTSRVGRDLNIPAHDEIQIRWAHAGLPEATNAVRMARYWLVQDWEQIVAAVEAADQFIPKIETGNLSWDVTLSIAYQHAVQSFLNPTEHIAAPTFVSEREPINGYSSTGDGGDMIRSWSGQAPTDSYLLLPAIATVDPHLAEGVIRNYIASQTEDGAIDWAPGAGGQRRDILCMPILAQLTKQVYSITQNSGFVEQVYPALVKFFNHWLKQDVDGDGLPEWRALVQTGYSGWRVFSSGVDITLTEGPDLLVYLISEAHALQAMAQAIGDENAEVYLTQLDKALGELWQNDQFVYRDRDTHLVPDEVIIVDKAHAAEVQIPSMHLPVASRVIVECFGGANHKPQFSVTLEGLDNSGNEVQEVLNADRFNWGYGRGAATSKTIFQQVDRVQTSGLSRIFRLSVHTVDLNDIDMNMIMPLWNAKLDEAQTSVLIQQLKDQLLRPNGLALYPPSDEPGATDSGIWVYWNALICEGLIQQGHETLAVDLIKRLLNVQTATVQDTGGFTKFYHEEHARGTGTRADIGGIVPLHILLALFGLTLHANGEVTVRAKFAWDAPVTIIHQGHQIVRNPKETILTFIDGTQVIVTQGTEQTVTPPTSTQRPSPFSPSQPKPKPISNKPPLDPTPIEIEVSNEDDV